LDVFIKFDVLIMIEAVMTSWCLFSQYVSLEGFMTAGLVCLKSFS